MTTADAKKNYRKPKESIVIHGGAKRIVMVHACSNCGHKLQANKVECQSILTRFKCPKCNQSIENTNENRCKTCYTRCSDSETYNAHIRGGCSYYGKLFPGSLLKRGEL